MRSDVRASVSLKAAMGIDVTSGVWPDIVAAELFLEIKHTLPH